MKNSLKRNSGFTIIEVVAVLVMLGIISAVAMSKVSINIDNIKRDEQLNILMTHLRYAQARAMNSDSEWGIKYGTVNIDGINVEAYWLFKGDGKDFKIRLPGEEKKVDAEDKSVTMSDLSITSISTGENFVAFNTLGSPVDTDGNSVTDITIETSGKDIIITENTGFIFLTGQ